MIEASGSERNIDQRAGVDVLVRKGEGDGPEKKGGRIAKLLSRIRGRRRGLPRGLYSSASDLPDSTL